MNPGVKVAGEKRSLILDTNTLVSGIIFRGQLLRRVVIKALDEFDLVFSNETWDELCEVFQRDKFNDTLALGVRLSVLANLAGRIRLVKTTSIVSDCRDPRDNKFLALALDAQASVVVSGDQDLKSLNPWRGLQILSPEEFLAYAEGLDQLKNT